MTDNNHPITPPLELVDKLASGPGFWTEKLVRAFQAGADFELEACCEWLRSSLPGYDKHYADYLHTARRPKPPSLKEQALAALAAADGADHPVVATVITADQHDIIRRALESLPD